ncbi:Endonuclease/Exonuclease/phosphatase family protein [Tritrichomonas foetus]|uniref:Carbon catabolite repressor protein 4 n=1 Tax=Tritrichomonas foetus TaxID=1144522 RepID=A0A1J4JH29_9EUKA|nr:Endonuclease/Exonuclease/phosphatase family protein [Tritrichomonas foetus]|eukprot:OHS98464.1 Endonuclease/Exonuclease/phosphatase family protein [Tritrichomonas foetus]
MFQIFYILKIHFTSISEMMISASNANKQIMVVIPISSKFEVNLFQEKVKDATKLRFISWPNSSNGKMTFKCIQHITYLDMHGLKLVKIPPEIGLLTNLEYLDVSDNCLEYLPPELAQCSKLQTLKFSGNALQYKNQMQALIDLRQHNQIETGTIQFKWTHPNASFTIITWNILNNTDAVQENFHKTPNRYLKWEYRSDMFIHTILNLKPHIVCIQDVEEKQLSLLSERMETVGYGCSASFAKKPRRPDIPVLGVATFFFKARLTVEKTVSVSFSDLQPNENISKLQLVANDSAFQVSVVRMQAQSFFLINAGLKSCKFEPEVLLAQISLIADKVEGLSSQAIICGSLGFKPNSAPYKLLSTGEEPSGKFHLKKTFKHAYNDPYIPIEFTQWDENGFSITDYIWISQLMQSTGYIIVPTKSETEKNYHSAPNSQWPSHHIPIGAAIDIRSSIHDM